jgi:hypothetical protein
MKENIQQHISQQEGGKQGLKEGPCQKAAGGGLPSLRLGAPCIKFFIIILHYNALLFFKILKY